MKIRADLTVNGETRRPFLVTGPNELDAHLAHKLAAYVLFWSYDPLLDASAKTPALAAFEFMPDLIGLDPAGEIVLWVECGTTTMHKLTKVTRRAPRARVVVLKENERGASQLRAELDSSFDRPERVEVLAWPDGQFKAWCAAVTEKTEAFGDASGHMINVVLNEAMFVVEFKLF
jgi:uncharacterized protein YaeQ